MLCISADCMLQGGAKRRRQASRTAYVPEDEDDEFGSQMTDAQQIGSDHEYFLFDSDEEEKIAKGSRVSIVA